MSITVYGYDDSDRCPACDIQLIEDCCPKCGNCYL